MWIITLALFLLIKIGSLQEDYRILIVDDCKNWHEIVRPKKPNHYSITKEIPVFHNVWLSHFWLFPEDSLTRIDLTYPEILKLNPQFTSELTTADWDQLAYGKDKKKIFMLKPDDFCSEKRFCFDEKFTLLEVRIHLSGDE